MVSPDNPNIYEWMDLVDVVVTDKDFLKRIREWFANDSYISESGVVLVRPGWLDSELNSDNAEHNEAASRIWEACKRLEKLRYVANQEVTTDDFRVDYLPESRAQEVIDVHLWADHGPEDEVRKTLYNREIDIWKLKHKYYDEAIDTDMSEGTRAKYRNQLNNCYVERNQAHQDVVASDVRWTTDDGEAFKFNPSPAPTPEQEQKYKRNAISAKRRKTTGSIFGFILKLFFYPIFLLFVINISGIYFGVFGILFVGCLIISPFYWLAGDKDFNPVSVTKLALQGIWIYIGSITVGYWED